MNWRGYAHAMGPKRLLEAILLSVFLLFFYGPLMNTLMIAFADRYMYAESRTFLPPAFSLKWWKFVLSQKNLVSSISLSFIVVTVTTPATMKESEMDDTRLSCESTNFHHFSEKILGRNPGFST